MNMPTLAEQLREHHCQKRREQVLLIEVCADTEDRTKTAASIIREIAMQRVFDRLTKSQETELLDKLWTLAYPDDGVERPPCFGLYSYDRVDRHA